jgi:hypothetical protein
MARLADVESPHGLTSSNSVKPRPASTYSTAASGGEPRAALRRSADGTLHDDMLSAHRRYGEWLAERFARQPLGRDIVPNQPSAAASARAVDVLTYASVAPGATNRRARKPRTGRPCCTKASAAPAISIEENDFVAPPDTGSAARTWPCWHGKGVPRSRGQPRKPRPRTRRMAWSPDRPGGYVALAKAMPGTHPHCQRQAATPRMSTSASHVASNEPMPCWPPSSWNGGRLR